MKKFLFIFLLFVLSCGKEKVVLLPEIEKAKISEVNDISPAYLFYEETQPDSIELNRANLIISTNWVVNVDKRLTLRQAIPKIKFLQEKKRDEKLHKNENARNYFTCHDLSINNLGFMDFTDVNYIENHKTNDSLNLNKFFLKVENLNHISLLTPEDTVITNMKITDIKNVLNEITNDEAIQYDLYLSFNDKLSFQDYISIKYLVSKLDIKNLTLINDEEIFNE